MPLRVGGVVRVVVGVEVVVGVVVLRREGMGGRRRMWDMGWLWRGG